jgi:DNA-binding response OmpR family regulator
MSTARVLVVDDEATTRDLMSRILLDAGYEVVDTFNAEEAVALLHRQPFDLVTLDVMMPHVDGFECCRRIRQFSDVPIVFVTARGESVNEIMGFESGADDYIQKPYHPDTVVSRVKALLRRSARNNAAPAAGATHVGSLTLDLRAQEAFVRNQPLGLTNKEFELLHVLISNLGQIVSREHLAEQVWGDDFDLESRTLDVHVYRLRRKLDQHGDLGRFVVTKRQRGYLISPAIRQSE